MPTESTSGPVYPGSKVRLRDGRTILVTDAVDQDHDFGEDEPVWDNICLGFSFPLKPKGKYIVFPASEVVSIIE